jgi:hypothetical protein
VGSKDGRLAPGAGLARASWLAIRGRIRIQPQSAGDDVAGHVSESLISRIRVGAKPDISLAGGHSQLHSQHASRLVNLGPVPGQVRGPQVQGLPLTPLYPRVTSPPASSSSSAVAASARMRHSPNCSAVSGPGNSRYRPICPARIAPIVSGNANGTYADLAGSRRERRPPTAGLVSLQVGDQDRGGRRLRVRAWSLAEGQLHLGQLLGHRIGHAHDDVRRLAAGRGYPCPADPF